MSGLSEAERAARYAALNPTKHPPVAFNEDDWGQFCADVEQLELPSEIIALRSTWEALYGHLLGCNKILNLTRLIAPDQWLRLNLLDSLVTLYDPRLNHLPDGATVIDLGSGGGYPGLPLAALFPTAHWILLDRVAKKANFLNQSGKITGAKSIEGVHGDAAELAAQRPELRRT
jgi:16S rRNA G527 N7-methylase RsmG